MFPDIRFDELQRALRASFNRNKRLNESFRSIFVRVLDEKIGTETKRKVVIKNFLRLCGQGNAAATAALLSFLSEELAERQQEHFAEQKYKSLLDAAKKVKSKPAGLK